MLAWDSYCNDDIIAAFEKKKHRVKAIPFDDSKDIDKQDIFLQQSIDDFKPDIVFSFNYFPNVSNVCMKNSIKYVGWVYDSPYLNLYSYTIVNECNSIYVFDFAVYDEFASNGITTVHYLPMATNAKRLNYISNSTAMSEKHSCDVSFVGSLYIEKKHNLYEKFNGLNDYTKGYLDGIIQAQLKVYGKNFLKESLTEDIISEMEKIYPTNPAALTVATPEFIYADYVLARKVTALERVEVIKRVSKVADMHLYTNYTDIQIGNEKNMGKVDYYNEMPFVFKNSKINLNITLRSIKTGMPLRSMDIMGCGGFLLTNFQEEYLEYFEPDKDFVYYEDMDDLEDKVSFYLRNDSTRELIAKNGFQKIVDNHSFDARVDILLS